MCNKNKIKTERMEKNVNNSTNKLLSFFVIQANNSNQGCGSGSVFRSFVDPDPYSEYGSAHVNIR